jgi:putative ABC transport system permease protein
VSRGLEYDEVRDGERLRTGMRAIRQDIAALPGVRHAAFASMAPFSNWESVSSLRMPGIDEELQARSRDVGPQYFSALGIAFLRGREFVESDVGEASPVIVDELFVQRWLQKRDPIGAMVDVPVGEGQYRTAAIVGVVRTVKHEALDETPELPTLYQLQPIPMPVGMLVTRVEGDPAMLAEAVRSRVLAHFPDAYISFNQPLSEAVARTLVGRRSVVETVSAFAVVTLALAVLGLYAVLSFAVRRRTAELGVRMALGADAPKIMRLVMGQGGVLIAIGVASGLVLGIPLARLLADRLHKVETWDPATWLVAGAIIATAALIACWLPARRATKVPPTVALRDE